VDHHDHRPWTLQANTAAKRGKGEAVGSSHRSTRFLGKPELYHSLETADSGFRGLDKVTNQRPASC
jgi:hypothetical protein